MANWLARIFGSRNQRLSQYNGIVRKINSMEPALQKLSDAELADMPVAVKRRVNSLHATQGSRAWCGKGCR